MFFESVYVFTSDGTQAQSMIIGFMVVHLCVESIHHIYTYKSRS